MDKVLRQILDTEEMASASKGLLFPSLWSNPSSENHQRVDTCLIDELLFGQETIKDVNSLKNNFAVSIQTF